MKTPPLQWKTWKQDHPIKFNFQSPYTKVFTFFFFVFWHQLANWLFHKPKIPYNYLKCKYCYDQRPIFHSGNILPWYLGTTLITDGETSDAFYFYTLPTSPPSDLECATTYDSLSLTWGNPTIGMVDNTSYQFSYTLVDSMYKS